MNDFTKQGHARRTYANSPEARAHTELLQKLATDAKKPPAPRPAKPQHTRAQFPDACAVCRAQSVVDEKRDHHHPPGFVESCGVCRAEQLDAQGHRE